MQGLLRLSGTLVACAAALVAFAPGAFAAQEAGDAGELPASAQDLGAETALDAISGTFETPLDHDLYRVCLSGGGTFSASTVGGSALDTQLFLFDADGRGLYADDDAALDVRQSTLPAGHALTPAATGVYLLGVSQYNQDPDSPLGAIFPNVPELVGATEIGAAEPLSAWTGRSPDRSGPYTAALTGVVACPQPDVQPPAIDLRTPTDGATFGLGEQALADYSCADEGGSGLASCEGTVPSGAPLDTSKPGVRSFAVRALDNAGNETVVTASYSVGFLFAGFLPPVRNPPEWNIARAGSHVKVAFGLGGFQGLDVLADGSPRSARTSCDPDPAPAEEDPSAQIGAQTESALETDPEDPATGEDAPGDAEAGDSADEAVAIGRAAAPAGTPIRRGPLRYDALRDRYLLTWKTQRNWAGGCRDLILGLSDGSEHRASFRFRRATGWWPWQWHGRWDWNRPGHRRARDDHRDRGHGRDDDRRGNESRHDRRRD